MKKLLLFSPLFLATLATGMIKNPASLRYLAAIKVPEHKMGTLHPELKVYAQQVKKIEITVKKAKEAAEIAAYRSQLKLLCAIPTGDPHLCEEIYSTTPHLYDLKTIHQMLKLCMLYSNTSIATWIFNRFPYVKQYTIMEEVLIDSIKANNLAMTQYVLENNQNPHIFTKQVFSSALNSKESVDLLFPYVLKELQKEASQTNQKGSVRNNIIFAMREALFRNDLHTTEQIFLNYANIKELCQEMLFERVSEYLYEIRRGPSQYRDLDETKSKFIVKFLNHSGKQKVQQILNRILTQVISGECFNPKNINFLLELGADRLMVNDKGQIPLQSLLSTSIEKSIRMDGVYHYYIDKTKRETVQILLSKQPQEQLCFVDSEGNTALHYPSAGLVIDLLTENGGDIQRLGAQGKTPLLTFIENNTKALATCDNDNNIRGYGYPTVWTTLFSQYLHSTPHAILKRNKPEILKQLHLLPQGQFKQDTLKLIEAMQTKWLLHTPKHIFNATFITARNKKITMPENLCHKLFSDVLAFVIPPEIKSYNSLCFRLKERLANAQNNETDNNDLIEKSPIARMEDID